jgi:hypothetical protein
MAFLLAAADARQPGALTGVLKGRLGFDGALSRLERPPTSRAAWPSCRAINAGIDMLMAPGTGGAARAPRRARRQIMEARRRVRRILR